MEEEVNGQKMYGWCLHQHSACTDIFLTGDTAEPAGGDPQGFPVV